MIDRHQTNRRRLRRGLGEGHRDLLIALDIDLDRPRALETLRSLGGRDRVTAEWHIGERRHPIEIVVAGLSGAIDLEAGARLQILVLIDGIHRERGRLRALRLLGLATSADTRHLDICLMNPGERSICSDRRVQAVWGKVSVGAAIGTRSGN